MCNYNYHFNKLKSDYFCLGRFASLSSHQSLIVSLSINKAFQRCVLILNVLNMNVITLVKCSDSEYMH